MSGDWALYDDMAGGLSPEHWKPFRRRGPDAGQVEYQEPGARTSTDQGGVRIEIDPFTRFDDLDQGLDNGKHIYKSARIFDLTSGVAEFSFEMAARKSRGAEDDEYRSGFTFFGLGDLKTGFVFDMFTNGGRAWALCERLRIGDPFTWVVDPPLLDLGLEPGRLETYRMRIDCEARSASYFVGDTMIFRAGDLPAAPEQLQFTFGFQTLQPLTEKGSRSLTGQGMTGWWRNARYQGATLRDLPDA